MLLNLVLPKNKTLVSEDESLKLCSVTDAQSGVYTLTVSTGTESLHREFTITVLTATTSLRTGECLHFFAAVSLFMSYSVSAFPQGWISNVVVGPKRLNDLINCTGPGSRYLTFVIIL